MSKCFTVYLACIVLQILRSLNKFDDSSAQATVRVHRKIWWKSPNAAKGNGIEKASRKLTFSLFASTTMLGKFPQGREQRTGKIGNWSQNFVSPLVSVVRYLFLGVCLRVDGWVVPLNDIPWLSRTATAIISIVVLAAIVVVKRITAFGKSFSL